MLNILFHSCLISYHKYPSPKFNILWLPIGFKAASECSVFRSYYFWIRQCLLFRCLHYQSLVSNHWICVGTKIYNQTTRNKGKSRGIWGSLCYISDSLYTSKIPDFEGTCWPIHHLQCSFLLIDQLFHC